MRQIICGKKLGERQRGDTLVEVLVAILIVSMVISGAYVVSNRSLQSTRGAQERSSALKLGESQIELLKSIVASNPDAIFGTAPPVPPTHFCLGGNATGVHVYDVGIPAQYVFCSVDSGGATPPTGQPVYTLQFTRTGNDFALHETWTDISGTHSDSLDLSYRAYAP